MTSRHERASAAIARSTIAVHSCDPAASSPCSTTSRVALLALVLLGALACGEPKVTAPENARPVIFVGLDAGDWGLLDAYMRDGTMPVLASLAAEGVTANLEGSEPLLSPIAWTTMMTGVTPLEHRVLDFFRFNPGSGALELISSEEREAPAVWNMASEAKRKVAVIGLWATWPAEDVNGTIVTERLVLGPREGGPLPRVVHPPARQEWARKALAETDASIGLEQMRDYIPGLPEDFRNPGGAGQPSEPVSGFRLALLQTRLYRRLALETIREESPDLSIVYFHGTDAVSHHFAPYSPPQMRGIRDDDYAKYSGVARRYFAEIDGILGELREIAEERGAIVVIASDHGFRWGAERPGEVSSTSPSTGAMWHRMNGVFLAWDPKQPVKGARRGSAEAVQLCATLLSLAGIAPAEGIAPEIDDAKCFSQAGNLSPVNYRRPFRRARVAPTQPGTSDEALEGLQALGYVSGRERATAPADAKSTRTAGSWNHEGRLLEARGDREGARRAYEKALEVDPKSPWVNRDLSRLLESSDPARSDELLLAAVANGLPKADRDVCNRADSLLERDEDDRARLLLERAERLLPGNSEIRARRATIAGR